MDIEKLRYVPWVSSFHYEAAAIRLHELMWAGLRAHGIYQPAFKGYITMLYITHGEGDILCNTHRSDLSVGNIVLSKDAFTLRAKSVSLDFIQLQISSNLADTLFNYIVEENGHVIDNGIAILPHLEQLYDLIKGGPSATADVEISARIYLILSLIHMLKNQNHAVDMALEYIREHYAEDILIEDLAQASYKSKYHFIRSFKKSCGCTPHTYLNEYRIKVARELIIKTEKPVSLIANETGFKSPAHFTQVFKKITGYNPREFRNIYK